MARAAVLLCCALFALAAFSSVSAQHSKSAVFTDKELTVKGDKKDGSFEATFPTKECTKACTETCRDETSEVCKPVTVKKCKKTPLEVETCEDKKVKKIVKKCKNTCKDEGKKLEVSLEQSKDGKKSISVKESGRKLLNKEKAGSVESGSKSVAITTGGSDKKAEETTSFSVSDSLGLTSKLPEVCKETCEDVEETVTEPSCEKKTETKETCEEVQEDKCKEVTKPMCKTSCVITCVPTVKEAVAGAAGHTSKGIKCCRWLVLEV